MIPRTVLEEVMAGRQRDVRTETIEKEAGFRVVPDVDVPDDVREWDLGMGESQVLGRALVERGALAVLDDRGARRCARAIGLGFTGTLGVVLACKRKGIICEAGPIIERLRATGMYMTDDLVGQILGMAGEGKT